MMGCHWSRYVVLFVVLLVCTTIRIKKLQDENIVFGNYFNHAKRYMTENIAPDLCVHVIDFGQNSLQKRKYMI